MKIKISALMLKFISKVCSKNNCCGVEVITTTNLPPMRDFSSHEKQESDE